MEEDSWVDYRVSGMMLAWATTDAACEQSVLIRAQTNRGRISDCGLRRFYSQASEGKSERLQISKPDVIPDPDRTGEEQ